jgi:hypothetical protein
MNLKSTIKPFWLRIGRAFTAAILVLIALPLQSASAATTDFSAPSIYSNSTLMNAGNAYVSDNIYAQSSGNNKSAVYGNFGFSIPTGSTINLVEVRVESHGNKNWKVAISKDNGATFSAYTTITNTPVDTITVTAGPGTLWGLNGWSANSLSNANFRVKIATAGGSGSNVAYLDQIQVRVNYTPISALPTTLALTSPTPGSYGGTVTLQAKLTETSTGLPISNKMISFTLDGFSKGSIATDINGFATLSNVALTTGLSGTLLNVGSYNVEASFAGDLNYAFSNDTETQVVNPRSITVTANAQSKVYGTNDPTLTYSFDPALISGDTFSGALARNAGENVGVYTITQGTLALSTNYAINYLSANLTITPLSITVTADDKAIHIGNDYPAFTFGVSNFRGSDGFITAPICAVIGEPTAAGSYPIVCSGGDAGSNYSINYEDGTLTISEKVILTVTANPQSKTYGADDPSFTFTYTGFVDGDDASVIDTVPTCSVIGAHINVGSYPSITCSGGSDNKYEFSYTSGTLTINPLGITVTADAKAKIYGAIDPVLSYTFAPSLIGGDIFSGTLARNIGENVGTYAVNQGTLTLAANYTITYVGANLTINKAGLTVTADDQTIGLATADPLFTFQYDGFVIGEDASVINTPPTCNVSGSHTALGTYPIVCSGGLDNNYSFTYVNGTLTVLPMITGNVGIGGATLNYVDTDLKVVLSDSNGDYAIFVPAGWSGTVTPSKAGFVFTPTSKNYNNVNSNHTAQNYSARRIVAQMEQWTTDYSYNAQGWRVEYHPRLLGDVNGDGKADIIGFGYDRVLVALSTGTSFAPMTQWTTDYSYNTQQWRVEYHPRLLGDVNGDGKDDIVGFGYDRVLVALSTGTNFAPMTQWTTDYSYNAQQWRVQYHPRVLGDVNGDGKDDIIGFGYDRVLVALSTGTSFAPMTQWTTDYSYNAQGWRTEYHPRMVGDVNGDGKADIIGFGYDRVLVALSTGTSFAPMTQWTTDYSYNAQQWRVEYHPRMVGDINGDGKADLIGFGYDRVLVALSTGTNFAPMVQLTADFSYNAQGWRVEYHPRLAADVSGDGLVDLVGFGNDRVLVAK